MYALVILTPEQGRYHMTAYKWLLDSQKQSKEYPYSVVINNNHFMIPLFLLSFEIKETACLKERKITDLGVETV